MGLSVVVCHSSFVIMTGGTKPHNRIAFNLATALDSHVAQSGCEVYITRQKRR